MRLQLIELLTLELAFRQPIGTAAGTHGNRPVLVVRLIGEEGEGWGECGALESGTIVDPTLDEVTATMIDTAVPRLLTATRERGGLLPDAWQIARLFAGRPADTMAGAAMEMAVLDLELRAGGQSLVSRLASYGGHGPGVRDSGGHPGSRDGRQSSGVLPSGQPGGSAGVAVGTMVGIPEDHDPGALNAAVERQVADGTARVRVKIEPGWDRVPLAALRERHPGLALQADANGAYRQGTGGPEDVNRLSALDDLSLTCIEQPLPPADLAALAEVARSLGTPICLDEALSSPARVTAAIRAGACAVACLKPARLGGLLAARRAAMECRQAGVATFVGGFFEAGLGRAANVALAHCEGFTLPGDLSPPLGYLDADPFPCPEMTDGRVTAPSGPGITALPDPEVMAERAVLILRRSAEA